MENGLIDTGIYKDCTKLRRILKRASFHTTKADRIIYLTPLIELSGELIKEFGLSYGLPFDKSLHAENFIGVFYIIKADIIELFEENVIKMTKQTICPSDESIDDPEVGANTHKENLNSLKVEIEGCVSRIQLGIGRWLTSTYKNEGKILRDET